MSTAPQSPLMTSTAPAALPGRSGKRRLYLQPSFLAAVAVLGAAALGLNATTQALQVHFKKLPVPLRVKLDDPNGVPATLGFWQKVTEQVSLNPDMQHELGTDQFVFRQYADTRRVPKDRLAELKDKDEKQQQQLLRKIMDEFPNSVVSLAVTYYTGLADRVTHVPDICMVAGGYRPASSKVVSDDNEGASFKLTEGGGERHVPFRYINFEDETGRGQVPTRVVYFFHCNGTYEESPQAVRGKLQDLRERHGYYAKVELMITDFRSVGRALSENADDPGAKASLEQMRDLIASALPEIERCLPDWAAVKAGTAVAKR